jgi:hypothetical protein
VTKKLQTYINKIIKNYEKILKFSLTFIPFLKATMNCPKNIFPFPQYFVSKHEESGPLGRTWLR